jgi:alcohol dehydrogenase
MLIGFDFQPRTRVIFGPGAIDRLGELARPLGTSALLVSDPGIVVAGHVERAPWIGCRRVNVTILMRLEEPTTREVDQCFEIARTVRPQLIIGLGGGAAWTRRGLQFRLTNGGRMQDYWGVGKQPSRCSR